VSSGRRACVACAGERAEYDEIFRQWPQIEGLSIGAETNLETIARYGRLSPRLLSLVLPADELTPTNAVLARVREKAWKVSVGLAEKGGDLVARWSGVAGRFAKEKPLRYYGFELTGDRAAVLAQLKAVRAVDPARTLVVPFGTGFIAEKNVIYAAGPEADDDAVLDFQLRYGARILRRTKTVDAARHRLFLSHAWDWTTLPGGASDEDLGKLFTDDRLQGFTAGTIAYPARLDPSVRFRGMGLGRGRTHADEFRFMEDAKAYGANCVRICVPSVNHPAYKATSPSGRIAEYLKRLDRRMDEIDELLDKARELDMKVVVSAFAFGTRDATGNGPGTDTMYEDASSLADYLDAVRAVARRIRGRKEVYGFDLQNETVDREYLHRVHCRDAMTLVARASGRAEYRPTAQRLVD